MSKRCTHFYRLIVVICDERNLRNNKRINIDYRYIELQQISITVYIIVHKYHSLAHVNHVNTVYEISLYSEQ